MSEKYIIRKRQNKILYAEIFIAAVVAGIVSFYYFNVTAGVGLLIGDGMAVLLLLSFLFNINGIFRYSFSLFPSPFTPLGMRRICYSTVVS